MRTGDTGIDSKPDRNYVAIGYIVKTYGLKGDVKISRLSDNPDRFANLKEIFIITKDGARQESCINKVMWVKGGLIISLASYTTVSDAEGLVGSYIAVPENEVPSLGKDTYYHYEIIGMDVFTTDGRCLGKIDDIISTGSNDVYVVKDDNHEYLIPAIRDVVKDVNIKCNRMVILPMEGLL
ncbi:MAG: ribosome maturation factor RimM [Nitrospirota bacterium]